MIVLIDNYDSFTYNLVQIMSGEGGDIRVYRNDETTVAELAAMEPDGLVVSPGPCTPREAGISTDAIRRFAGRIPVLGVCLGHQCLAAAFGAEITGAGRIMHGKTSMVTFERTDLYRGIKNPFPTGRYHSLSIVKDSLPPELVIDATSEDSEIMGVHHRDHPVYGVQFHPESVLTPSGRRLLRNFLQIVEGASQKIEA